jgi:glycerol kinase
MSYILAVDQGTHASRAAIIDEHGAVVAQHLTPVTLTRPGLGRAEQDAEQIADSVEQAIEQVFQQLSPSQRAAVRCCGVATQRSTVLAWRRNGTAVSAALSWQDTRGAPQLQHLRTRSEQIRKISGLPVSPHYGATKLHWLHQLTADDPETSLGPLSSFLLQRLTGEQTPSVDHCNAQRTQLFDIQTLQWSPTLVDWFDIPPERLPICRPVSAEFGYLKRWDVPVRAMSGDQNAAWFAAGQPAPGVASVNLGSGAFVLAEQSGEAVIADLLSSIVYSDAHHCAYVAEGTVNGAGTALTWLETERGIAGLQDRLPGWLEQVTEPPLFMNTVGGLGSPWWRAGVAPTFVDDCATCDDASLAAAVAESIVFLLQCNLDCIGARARLRRLRVSGGLSRIAPVCQKLANLSGYPVERPEDQEATLRGVAWLAAGRPGSWNGQESPTRFVPSADARLRDRYQRFVESLRRHLGEPTYE